MQILQGTNNTTEGRSVYIQNLVGVVVNCRIGVSLCFRGVARMEPSGIWLSYWSHRKAGSRVRVGRRLIKAAKWAIKNPMDLRCRT